MQLLPIRDRLVFPAGVAPGIDPNHVAFRSGGIARMSAVASAIGGNTPSGSFIEVQQAVAASAVGSPSPAIGRNTGPTIEATANGVYNQFTGLQRAVTFNEGFTLACIFRCTNNPNNRTLAVATSTTLNTGYLIGSFNAVPYLGLPGQADESITALPSFVLGRSYFFALSYANFAVITDLTTGQISSAPIGFIGNGLFPTDGNYAIGAGPSQSGSSGVGAIAAACHLNVALGLQELLTWAADPWSFWYPSSFDMVDDFIVALLAGRVPYNPWPQAAPILAQ